MEIIVKPDYSHYNRELGKYIRTKRQYNDELKRQGKVPYEQGKDIAERAREKAHKPYKVDTETARFLAEVKDTATPGGKVKLSGRQLAYMEKKGINFKKPEQKGLKGGFEDAV